MTQYKKTLGQAFVNVTAKLPMEDKSVEDRAKRAYEIVRQLGSGYAITKEKNWYSVYRESTSLLEDNSVHYHIDSEGCSCPDASSKARAGLCKHRLAVLLIEEMHQA